MVKCCDCNGNNNGSATTNTSGGTPPYEIEWANGEQGPNATSLPGGVQNVTITDDNGCVITSSVTINEPPLFTNTIANSQNISCHQGSDGIITITSTGGITPYTYIWNNGNTTNSSTNLVAGAYFITISDANGCTDSASATITAPNQLFAFTSVLTTPTCNNTADGSVQGFGTGGTGTYTYEWSNGATTQTIAV